MMNKEEQFNEIMDALGLPKVQFRDGPNKHDKPVNKQEISLTHYVRSHAYIVGSIDAGGTVSFSNIPAIHPNSQTARAECARLAAQNPGKAFVFVQFGGAELRPTAPSVSI